MRRYVAVALLGHQATEAQPQRPVRPPATVELRHSVLTQSQLANNREIYYPMPLRDILTDLNTWRQMSGPRLLVQY